MTEQKAHTYLQQHRLSGEVLRFALGDEDEALRAQAAASPERRAAKTLVKEGLLRLTMIALRQGAVLDEHETPGPCTIHALRGEVRLSVGRNVVGLGPGEMVALDTRTPHSVEALEDSALLLTVTMPPGERAGNE